MARIKSEVITILAKSIPFRKEFNLAVKEVKESPSEWLSRVNELAKLCGFGNAYDFFVLDKFVTGLEPDLINHLCSCAEYLDIESVLEIIDAYSSPKTNAIIREQCLLAEQTTEVEIETKVDDSTELVWSPHFHFIKKRE